MIPGSFTQSTGNSIRAPNAPGTQAPDQDPSIYIQNTAAYIDLSIVLLFALVRWRLASLTPLSLPIFEFRTFETQLNRLMAIESAFGSLRNLSADQLRVFEEATKRRPFFDEVSP